MTHAEIRALAAGFAPVIHQHVRDEINKATTTLVEEIAQLRTELARPWRLFAAACVDYAARPKWQAGLSDRRRGRKPVARDLLTGLPLSGANRKTFARFETYRFRAAVSPKADIEGLASRAITICGIGGIGLIRTVVIGGIYLGGQICVASSVLLCSS
jgi:hypothetical protein